MATTAKPRKSSSSSRTSPTRRARAEAGPPKPSAKAAVKRKAATKAIKASTGAGGIGSKLAGKAARKSLKLVARSALRAGTRTLRSAAERGAELTAGGLGETLGTMGTRLPIQVSVDVAAPLEVVWDEWMDSRSLPEGVHHVEKIKRKGNRLKGKIAGPRPSDWAAEIHDEREYESFAWQSIKGSDCAGLVTFHELSERLTRIELDLDVQPTKPTEALTLTLHVAHRHAEADLRRFKAKVEFISPDVYESNGNHNGSAQDDTGGQR